MSLSAPSVEAAPSLPPQRGLVWSDLTEEQSRLIPGRPAENVGEDEANPEKRAVGFEDEAVPGDTVNAKRRNFVKRLLGVTDANVRDDIFIDYMTNAVLFAQENKFTDDQTSVFFAVSKRTFENSKGESTESTGNFVQRDDSYSFFQGLVLQHSFERPPESVKVFTKEQVRSISDYMSKTFFRHYLAYEVAFTREQELHRLPLDVVVETPMVSLPLSKAKEVPRPEPEPEVQEAPEEEGAELGGAGVEEGAEAAEVGAPVEEEEEIVLPEHLQKIADQRIQAERNRLHQDIEDMSKTLAEKASLAQAEATGEEEAPEGQA